MPTLAPPNGELVAQAWISAHTSLLPVEIARSLPSSKADEDRPVAQRWKRFLTVRALPAGVPNVDITERRGTIVQLDAWGRIPTSGRPQWGVAWTVMETIRLATFERVQPYGRSLDMPVAGYDACRVLAAYLVTEPTAVEGDPSAYARITCDLAVDWTV